MTDRELEHVLQAWGRHNRARLDARARVSEPSNRARIMQMIDASSAQQPIAPPGMWSVFALVKQTLLVFRMPVGVVISVLVIVGFFGSTVYASLASMPGDRLYPLKLQLEQAQLELAPTGAKRLERKMAFAEHRLQELSTLLTKGRAPEQKAAVQRAMERYRSEVGKLNHELALLRNNEDPKDIVRLAVRLDDMSLQGVKTLSAIKPDGIKQVELTKTRTAAQTAGVEALGVIAATHDQAGFSADEVRSRIEKKISAAKEYVRAAAGDTIEGRPADDIFSVAQRELAAAEQYLARADFGNALAKVRSGDALAGEAQNNQQVVAPVAAAPVVIHTEPVATTSAATPRSEAGRTMDDVASPAAPPLASHAKQNIPQNAGGIDVFYSPSKPAYYFDE